MEEDIYAHTIGDSFLQLEESEDTSCPGPTYLIHER